MAEGTVIVGAHGEGSDATGVNGNQGDDSAAGSGAAYVFPGVPGPGAPYCLASANSTGVPAHILSGGSASVTAGNFSLFAGPAPTSQNGIFFYGPDQAQVPFGNGFLCVAPGTTGIARLPVVQVSSFEFMTQAVDFSVPPTAVTQITAGSRWNFQAWFRDPLASPAFFNLSDGLSVTFSI